MTGNLHIIPGHFALIRKMNRYDYRIHLLSTPFGITASTEYAGHFPA